MSDLTLIIIAALTSGILFGIAGYSIKLIIDQRSQLASKNAINQQINMAQERSQEILIEAKEEALQIRSDSEKEINNQKNNLLQEKNNLESAKQDINNKLKFIDKENKKISDQLKFINNQKSELKENREIYAKKIEQASDITLEEAKEILLKEAQEDIEHNVAKKYRIAEEELEKKVEDHAKNVIAEAIQRFASEVVGEETVQAVSIPNEEMKGRLIGRDGRNIRAIEKTTGVDLIVDESPDSVTVSCFDPIRRQVAINLLKDLIKDGRIHPARIESLTKKAQGEINKTIKKAGEDATFDSNVKGLPSEIIEIIGRLKYRYSYGENVLQPFS